MNNISVDGQTVSPSKVVCIGRNYVEHIRELNNAIPDQPVIFVKPNSAVCSELCTVKNTQIHYEAELAFVIQAEKISAVGFSLDLTKRELQSKLKAQGLPWERAKAFDKSAVFSEFVSFSGKLEALSLQLFINDQLTQQASVDLMIYKPQLIIAEVSTFMSFADGDVLMTGTPKGVGEVHSGDCFVGRVYDGEQLIIEQRWNVC